MRKLLLFLVHLKLEVRFKEAFGFLIRSQCEERKIKKIALSCLFTVCAANLRLKIVKRVSFRYTYLFYATTLNKI